MTTILKMIFSIVKTVFTIFWKIVKHLAGPMRESCKSLWKVAKMLYKNHQEKKAAGVAVTEGKGNEVVAGAAESTIATQGARQWQLQMRLTPCPSVLMILCRLH